MSKKKRKRRKISGRFFAFIAIIVIAAVGFGIYLLQRNDAPTTTNASNSDIQSTSTDAAPTTQPDNQPSMTNVSDLVPTDEPMGTITDADTITDEELSVTKGLDPAWRNILLLGTDARVVGEKSRTDTMMIASINTNDGRIKLTSLQRDMIVPLTWRENYQNENNKINSAAYYAGPKGAMRVVNECFGLNITEYVLVNMAGLQEAIDRVGGITMDLSEEERLLLNHNITLQARMIMTREEWDPEIYNVKSAGAGIQLTGLQAVAYARIRKTSGNDFARTERQRKVMEALFQKVKGKSIPQVMSLTMEVWKDIETNISMGSATGLATVVISNGIPSIDTRGRIPMDGTYDPAERNGKSALYDVDFEKNKQRLHNYIYNE